MPTPQPKLATNPTQLVRYTMLLPAMQEPDSLAVVRDILTTYHLLVDRIEPGEAMVASATGADPDWPGIKQALQAAGYPAEHTTTTDD